MKVILTGSSGFVGVNLAVYLRQNDVETMAWSLRDNLWHNQLSNGVTALIHLAGKAHDTKNASGAVEYFKVNRDLTIELFDYFLTSDIRDFIYFSSVKAVADSVDGTLVEDVEGTPLTSYGKSKLEAEQYLLSKELPEGKRLFILRPCMIHGPGNKGNLNLLYNVVKKGIPYPLAAFDNQRSFLSIANLNYVIEQLISKSEIPGGVYNVADDEPLSTNDVIGIINEAIGSKPKLWKINKKLIAGIAAIGDFLHLPLNSERLKKLTESYVVSNDKIKHALKQESLPMSSSQGLLTTAKSFDSL